MRSKNSLFDTPKRIESQAVPASTALVISGQRLEPEQKLFDQLLAKIEKTQETLRNLLFWVGDHRVQYAKRTSPLEQQLQTLQKQMVVFLDQRLQNSKGLSKSVRAYMVTVVCSLAASMMNGPDGTDMVAIYERYAPAETLHTQADATALQDMLADVFGLDIGDDAGLHPPEQGVAAVMRKTREQRESQASFDAVQKAKRKKTPKQMHAERAALDADKVLRDIFRKLASALHPDREPNEQERQRKTALMVEANVANEKKDLLALLQLQRKVAQIDTSEVSAIAQEKLRHFNCVLKAQAQSLQMELDRAQFVFRTEFHLSYSAITPRSLEISLRHTVRTMEEFIGQITLDLTRVQYDHGLKAWIKEQKALSDAGFDDFDAAEFDAFSAALVKATGKKTRPARSR